MLNPRLWALSIATPALAVGAMVVPSASAAGPPAGGATAPAYPGNSIAVDDPGTLVAGRVTRVKLRGHAQWNEVPTTSLTTNYDLALYVQDASVDPGCASSYGAQLQKSINLPGLSAAASISGFVLDGQLEVSPRVPEAGVDWSTDSVPFSVRPGVRSVVLCAYQRYIVDDAAYFQRPAKVEPLRCSFRGAVRRGSKAGVRCNFSGDVDVRLRKSGAKARTLRVRISGKGTGTLATKGLARGLWSATFSGKGLKAGTARLRVR